MVPVFRQATLDQERIAAMGFRPPPPPFESNCQVVLHGGDFFANKLLSATFREIDTVMQQIYTSRMVRGILWQSEIRAFLE